MPTTARASLSLLMASLVAACDVGLPLPNTPLPPDDARSPPRLDAVSPLAAFIGQPVTLTGAFPDATTLETKVRFGTSRETPVDSRSEDGTTLVVTVPSDALDGPVTVLTPGGSAASVARFNVYGPGRVRAGATVESLDRRVKLGLVAPLADGSGRLAVTLRGSLALLGDTRDLAWIEAPRFADVTALHARGGWIYAAGVPLDDGCDGALILRGRPGGTGLVDVETRCLSPEWPSDAFAWTLRVAPDGARAFVAGTANSGRIEGLFVTFGSAPSVVPFDPPEGTNFTGACWRDASHLFVIDSTTLFQVDASASAPTSQAFTLPDDDLGYVAFDCADNTGVVLGVRATLLDLSTWPPTSRPGPVVPAGYPFVTVSRDGSAFLTAASGVVEEVRLYALDTSGATPLAQHVLEELSEPALMDDGTFVVGDLGRAVFFSSRTGNVVEVAPLPTRPTSLAVLSSDADPAEPFELAVHLSGTAEIELFPVGSSIGDASVLPLEPGLTRVPGLAAKLLSTHDAAVRFRRDRRFVEVLDDAVCRPALPGLLTREMHSSADGAVVVGLVPVDDTRTTITLLPTTQADSWCDAGPRLLTWPEPALEAVARANRLYVATAGRLTALRLDDALGGKATELWSLVLPEGDEFYALDADDRTLVFLTRAPGNRDAGLSLWFVPVSGDASEAHSFTLGGLDQPPNGDARALILAPDGKQVWLRTRDRITAFEQRDGTLVRAQVIPTPGLTYDFALSPDGETLFFTGVDEDLLHVVR